MKLVKKLTATALAATMAVTLTGCGGGTSIDIATQATTAAGTQDSTTQAAGTDGTQAATTTAVASGVDDSVYAVPYRPDETVTLNCYSQLANYSGEMQGWLAKILLDKFNVKINVIPESSGVYETKMQEGDLGDIVIWGSDGDDYTKAVAAGMLWNWNDEDLLNDYGPYIAANMKEALAKNASISSSDGKAIYGFGHNVASTSADHDQFFYSWDIRWDLYEQLGHPSIANLDDYFNMLVDMKGICPKDENGNETYATSIWPDWDGTMVMYIKAAATAYYGYDELGIGLYDCTNGDYHDALEENGPYLTMLKYFNRLYQAGLLDPNSMTQTYAQMGEKVLAGGTFFSIFNYSGSAVYNTDDHIAQNKMMLALTTDECCPIVYGMNTAGGNRIWSIGANTQYPELCMEIINWLATPQGELTTNYGPMATGADDENGCWYYGDDGLTHFTELGKKVVADATTPMPDADGGLTFDDGNNELNNTTWDIEATNPETGERYDYKYWASEQTAAKCDTEQDWRDFTGVTLADDYLSSKKYTIAVGTTYSEGSKSNELDTVWTQVTGELVSDSWKAIYATSDDEYDKIVADMITNCNAYGYDQCVQWSKDEAAKRNALEEPLRAAAGE